MKTREEMAAINRAVGQKKYGNRLENPFIIHRHQVKEVALGSYGDLLLVGSSSVAARASDMWPKLFKSRESAQRALDHIQAKCNHDFAVTSHESLRCKRCGHEEHRMDF